VTITSMPQLAEPLSTAREAAGRHAWREAYDAYGAAERGELTPGDLERYADAAWWTGKIEEAISLRERAYAGFTAAGDRRRAARVALTLNWDHVGREAYAVAGGWFANAERLLENEPESSEHGFLALTRGLNALFGGGTVAEALAGMERAADIARRFGDRDVEMIAVVGTGRTIIRSGDVERGLAMLDQATASAVCGHLRPFTTGLVYCITISTCHDLGDFRRAAEWTEEANRWCDRLDVSGFPGACRIHRAEVMRLRGDWDGAERQAQAACDELEDFERRLTANGYYEIGEIRRRQGNFAAAEEAYARANELGQDPQPGLSLLRLSSGQVDAAAAGVRRAIADSKQPLLRLRHLLAQVEVAVATADLATAGAAADEAESIVDAYKIGGARTPAFDASIHLARGRILLAEGAADAAALRLQHARDEWQKVGAPYETAHARLALGMAYREGGDEHAATAEIEAALATFERLGARLDEARCRDLLGRVEASMTFLFTDIVDSTKLLGTLGEEKYRRLLARHDELLREQIVKGGGAVIKNTGDGFFASFDDAGAAVRAAIAIQKALADEIVAPDVRIGAHSGEAFRTGSGYTDYGGETIHLAARVGAAAGAGEILVSRQSLDGVAGAFRLSEPRTAQLKGFDEPVEVVAVDWR
jgi:class 3 adenylate cyclase